MELRLPTWNGAEIGLEDVRRLSREAFEVVHAAMGGPSVLRLSQLELLHLVEATSLLEIMTGWVEQTAYLTARDNGASWATLGNATGVSRSTAQSRYEGLMREQDRRLAGDRSSAPDAGRVGRGTAQPQ